MTDIAQDPLSLLRGTIVDKRPVDTRPQQLNFVFYGRVSTDDLKGLQDSEVSRAWQYKRATDLIRDKGEVTQEFFDEGVSRSIPFLRRPKAAELLRIVAETKPDFHAVVIGEAKRVFSGSQLEDVYYLLARQGIDLWIPELGGRYDENNITHRMLLSFEGIMGKVESDTVRGRVKDAMTSIATSTDKRWLGGNAPYGYRLAVLEKVEKRGAGSKGFTQTLEIHPDTAPIVRRIFSDYLAGKSLREIASALTAERIPTPTGKPEWNIGTLSTILDNQTYTGFRVYGKQRKHQVPYDENDRRLGTVTARTRNGEPPVLSSHPVYPTLISLEDFTRVHTLRQSKRTLTGERSRPNTKHERRPLQGRIYYNDKKMTVERTRHGKVRYRWKNQERSEVVSVYEWQVEQILHQWLSDTFSRNNLPLLLKQLRNDAPKLRSLVTRLEDEREKKLRAAHNLLHLVEEGDEAATVRYRLRLAEAKELEAQLTAARAENIDISEVEALMKAMTSLTREATLKDASEKTLTRLYDALGLRVEYLPEIRSVRLHIAPAGTDMRVGRRTPPDETPDDGSVEEPAQVVSKVGAPGGALTLRTTRPRRTVLMVVLPLPQVA